MPPRQPEVASLAEFPYVVVRVACTFCPKRNGSYRLARLAAKFGPETPLAEVLERIAFDCPYRGNEHRRKNKYVPQCHARFLDLDGPTPPPPDLPPTVTKLRVVQGGKASAGGGRAIPAESNERRGRRG